MARFRSFAQFYPYQLHEHRTCRWLHFAGSRGVLAQVILFVVLCFVSIQSYRTGFRQRGRRSDQPLLNRRAEQLIGRVVVLDRGIANGIGPARIDDAFWGGAGVDLPAGSTVHVVAVDGTPLKVPSA